MKAPLNPNLACRYCRHYSPEGHRGGACERLSVHVQGQWSACSLMIPSFSSDLKQVEQSSELVALTLPSPKPQSITAPEVASTVH
jgi:hypothetical protein